MSYTFSPEPHPPLLSKNTSTSSTKHSKRDGTRYSPVNADSMSKSVMHTAPAYGYRPPSASSPHSLPEHGYRIQPQSFSVQTYRITEAEDKGEDSDYYHESTPGRAWKETKQATPRMRVVGFNVSTAHTPKSGANGTFSSNSYTTLSRTDVSHNPFIHMTAIQMTLCPVNPGGC